VHDREKHDREKWLPVFRKDHARSKTEKRDGDSPSRSKALHTNVQTSQPIPTHIVLLIVSAKTQGNAEEYRRAGLLTTVVTSCAPE
jgi:hypothetical protein